MYCQNCGKELPAGAYTCAACGATVPEGHRASTSPSVYQLLAETRRTARELANATAELSHHLAATAGSAARDPAGTAKKAADKLAKELDAAAEDIKRILKEL